MGWRILGCDNRNIHISSNSNLSISFLDYRRDIPRLLFFTLGNWNSWNVFNGNNFKRLILLVKSIEKKIMNKTLMITHNDFVNGYKSGKYLVYVDKNKAGDFVMSKPADKYNKPAHLFWTWVGILMTFPLPIIFLFISWKYSIVSFILGLIVSSSSKKSDGQFVMKNMIDDKNFWEYVLMYKGVKIEDKEGNEVIYSPDGKRRIVNEN